MTKHETEAMDEYGSRLGRELHALSAAALQPFDAVAVAHEVAVAHPRASRPLFLGGAVPLAQPRLNVRMAALATTILLLALVGWALVAGGAVTPPKPIAGVGDIAFAHADYDNTGRERPSNLAIFTVTSEGDGPTRLAAVPETVPWPVSGLVGPAVRWSPDGSRMAFRLFHDEAGIWIMDRDGSDLHRLVELPLDDRPSLPFLDEIDWSPDGTRIAYAYPYDGVRSPLYVVDVGDGQVTNLTGDDPSRGATRAVAWSPDGSRIAFARTNGAGSHSGPSDGLFVMNADGTGEIRLAPDELTGTLRGLTWAPDGQRIAFIWESYPAAGPVDTLMVIEANGQGLRDIKQLHVGGGCCFFESTDLRPLEWSPDGDRIALVFSKGLDQGEGELETIMLVPADGSGASEVTKGSYFDLSPDGSRMVVAEARLDEDPGSYSIYVVNIDGTSKRWLAEGEFPAWSPIVDK